MFFFVEEMDFYLGATPDGLIGQNGLVEIKCPYSSRQLSPIEAIQTKKLTYMESGKLEQFHLKKIITIFFKCKGSSMLQKETFATLFCGHPKDSSMTKLPGMMNFSII